MIRSPEPGGRFHFVDGRGHRPFELGRGLDICNVAAFGADEMVVVPTGQVLRQFVPRVFVARDDAVHDAGGLEDDEISVRGTLRQRPRGCEDLRDREGSVRPGERIDQRPSVGRDTLIRNTEALLDCGA